MARTLTWAGGEHDFDLRIEHLRALQDRCDAGPEWILSRLTTKQWLVDDVIQTIRLGLEGGGMPKEDARKLVAKFVEDRPLTLSVLTAQAILLVALYGNEDDQPGELKAGAKKTRNRSREESGNSTSSTSGQE
ncbi:gene transfer agent family protein [Paenochrobactrum pullorum]|uniref:gene transfer agent family protein n=1 Tax=Paenochrobactrum pullorum TaxID=1324351 RepID=UPI0035BC0B62